VRVAAGGGARIGTSLHGAGALLMRPAAY
jgi:hypothetical protein